jgi:hypothetical protein
MANISADVSQLRDQYKTGKSNGNGLVVQYNGKEFQDGDELKKADTQTAPEVQISIETDPENPYFTLVIFFFLFFYLRSFLFFYSLDHGRSGCSSKRQ